LRAVPGRLHSDTPGSPAIRPDPRVISARALSRSSDRGQFGATGRAWRRRRGRCVLPPVALMADLSGPHRQRRSFILATIALARCRTPVSVLSLTSRQVAQIDDAKIGAPAVATGTLCTPARQNASLLAETGRRLPRPRAIHTSCKTARAERCGLMRRITCWWRHFMNGVVPVPVAGPQPPGPQTSPTDRRPSTRSAK
jgi:hypothetical protein